MSKVSTHILVGGIVQRMDSTIRVNSIEQIGSTNKYIISTYCTKWLLIGRSYEIDGEQYLISEVVANESFTIELSDGQTAPDVESFTIPLPFFYYGTFKAINNEISRTPNSKDKIPFILLHEPSKDRNIRNAEDSRDRESDLELYIMQECNYKGWDNDEHYKYCIASAKNIEESFFQAARNTPYVGEFEESNSENHVRWGTIGFGGHEKKIFNDDLSGIKTDVTLPFLKQSECGYDYNPQTGSVDVVVNVDGVEYYNETITEDTTINIVYE